jgi:putative ABC transport system permease protein
VSAAGSTASSARRLARVMPLRRLFSPSRVAVFRETLETYMRRPLRTALSGLGVAMGVSAFVATIAVIDGARRQTLADSEQLGLDTVVVRDAPARPGSGAVPITIGDALGLRALGPSITSTDAVVEGGVALVGSLRTGNAWMLAATPGYIRAVHLSVRRGRLLNLMDAGMGARVCLVGEAVARELYGEWDPIGRELQVGRAFYAVVGIMSGRSAQPSRGYPGVPVIDPGRVVVLPLSAWIGHSPQDEPWRRVSEIRVRVSDSDRVDMVGGAVSRALRAAHPGGSAAVVIVPRALVDQRLRLQRTFALVFGSVALFTLTVGGIGIMNVTLASVLERIPEIGIRRSVGATRRQISVAFLVETAVLGIAGGIAGLLGGILAARAIGAYAGWEVYVAPLNIAVALVLAIGIGVASGVYPAWRASMIAPVEAVRHE